MKRLLSSIFVLLMLFLVVGCDNHNNQVVYYNVTVNLMDDVDDPTILMQRVLSGNKAVEPEVPLIPHMKCLGFYDGDTLWDFENDLVTKDLELIAKWEEGIQDYEEAEELIAAIDTKDFESIKLARNKTSSTVSTDEASETQDAELEVEPYPLVMDAPSSSFDIERIANFCKIMPNIAEQVIFFIKDTDGFYVKNNLKNVIGKEYVMNKINNSETDFEEVN